VGADEDPFEVEMITTIEYWLERDMAQAEPWHDDATVTPLQSAQGRTPSLLPASPPHVVHAVLSSSDIDLNNDHDEHAPLRFMRIDNVLGPAHVPGLAQRVLQEELHAVIAEEPAMLEEAVCDLSWCVAMVEELRLIEKNCTWDMVDPPAGHRPIGLKWVYKANKVESGHVIKLKTHLVTKGCV
jgi:hypothetical protein